MHGRGPDMPGEYKNALRPVGIILKEALRVKGNKPSPSKEGYSLGKTPRGSTNAFTALSVQCRNAFWKFTKLFA